MIRKSLNLIIYLFVLFFSSSVSVSEMRSHHFAVVSSGFGPSPAPPLNVLNLSLPCAGCRLQCRLRITTKIPWRFSISSQMTFRGLALSLVSAEMRMEAVLSSPCILPTILSRFWRKVFTPDAFPDATRRKLNNLWISFAFLKHDQIRNVCKNIKAIILLITTCMMLWREFLSRGFSFYIAMLVGKLFRRAFINSSPFSSSFTHNY